MSGLKRAGRWLGDAIETLIEDLVTGFWAGWDRIFY